MPPPHLLPHGLSFLYMVYICVYMSKCTLITIMSKSYSLIFGFSEISFITLYSSFNLYQLSIDNLLRWARKLTHIFSPYFCYNCHFTWLTL